MGIKTACGKDLNRMVLRYASERLLSALCAAKSTGSANA